MKKFEPQTRAGGALPSRAPFHDSRAIDDPSQSSKRQDDQSQSSKSGAAAEAPEKSGDEAPSRMAADGAPRRSLTGRFNVNAQTGGVSCTIPIATSPGRSGFGPELSLQYESGAGGANGAFGMGWSLTGVEYITRKTSQVVPKYDDETDTFVHSRVGDLVPVEQDDAHVDGYRVRKYRARFEDDPLLIHRWKKGNETFWRTISSNNVTIVYGRQDNNQIFHRNGPEDAKKIFTWLASETHDGNGNHIQYSYKAEDSVGIQQDQKVYESHRIQASPQKYLKTVHYGNVTPSRDLTHWDVVALPSEWLFQVVFDYGEHDDELPTTQENRPWELRPDPFSAYNSGFEVRTYRRCRRILMFHHFSSQLKRPDSLASSTSFQYRTETHSGTTVLQSYTQNGHRSTGEDKYWTLSLPPVEFTYSTVPTLADLPVEEMPLPISGITSEATQWVDLDSEGAPGVLTKAPGSVWYYQRNLTHDGEPQVGEPSLVRTAPSVADAKSKWDFEDIRLDGLQDVVITADESGLRGFYEREEDGSWLNFVPFESYPVVAHSESIRRIDLNGDGYADLLDMSPADGGDLTWHASQGPGGFGAALRTVGAPVLPLQDRASSVQLCDITGDGLADIVQIRNGNICYWPNLGHGKFGPKVTMGNAPWMMPATLFSPQCIRMADLTGSGTTDLVYLHAEGGATAYYNQSGNAWSEGHAIPSFPTLDQVSAVDVLDIRGQGTPCLCWTSDLYGNSTNGLATVRFVDLMGMQKPGLLKKWSNGSGSETEFTYQSSFSFYRQDERQGNPWSTRLPFPIQCVAKTVTRDRISHMSHTTRYAFHNGYYDHQERQFRGFQLVDVWDAEQLDSADVEFQRPPVLTRNWFYTGLQRLDEPAILPQSYRVDGPRHIDIPSATIMFGLSLDVSEEAYRALAGRQRRSEVFSVDPTDKRSALPYVVTQTTYEAVVSQGQGSKKITRVNDRESVTAHYERAARDGVSPLELAADKARVQQHLVLQTDQYGNVLLEADIQYGKAASELLTADDQARQKETVVTYTETSYTKGYETHDYVQIPLPYEVQKYRVFPPAAARPTQGRYEWAALAEKDAALLKGARTISIEDGLDWESQHTDPGGSRVLVSKQLTLYTSGDLRAPLAAGALEPYSIVHQTYQLAFTSSLVEKVLKNAQPAISSETYAEYLHEAGYVELPIDSGNWWTASKRSIFGDNSPEQRLAAARKQFYLANGEIDAFGKISTTEFDEYYLLVASSMNAVRSRTIYKNEYASLQPVMVTDANKNRTQTTYDPLGRPIGVALLGKEDDAIGNSLDGFQNELDEATLDAFVFDPVGNAASLLAKASSRTIYQLDRYYQDVKSNAKVPESGYIAELTRHEHVGAEESGATRISIRFQYVNGLGEVIQTASLSGISNDARTTVWDFSGWVVNDNKNQPVQKFHPFQAPSHTFRRQAINDSLLAETLLRDPLDRVVATLSADHSWTKTRFTPWTQVTFDVGNTVMIEDPAQDGDVGEYFQRLSKSLYIPTWHAQHTAGSSSAKDRLRASQSEVYAAASTAVHLDAMGRPIFGETGKSGNMRVSRTKYSARGQVANVQDTLNRTVDATLYDLQGRPLYNKNMDGGEQWSLPDSQGQPFLSWSSKRTRKRTSYDALRRATGVWLLPGTDADSTSEIQIIKKVYGESAENAVENNLAGQLYQCYDQSGLSTFSSFDIQGACTVSSVLYAVEFRKLLDWSNRDSQPLLESKKHENNARYNALGLATETSDKDLGRIRREFDLAGRLKKLQSFDAKNTNTITSSVQTIEYEADGQVSRIVYLNGAETSHTYDPQTRHLLATRSVRVGDKMVLQVTTHSYDVLGKIVQTATVDPVHRNASPTKQQFQYDHFGQLLSSTGRVQSEPGSKQLRPSNFNTEKLNSNSGGPLIRYKEIYTYDEVGNIRTMQLLPEGEYSGWTRGYSYAKENNRLTSTRVGSETQDYRYEGEAGKNGCMTSIPGYSSLSWDYDDRLRAFSTQRVLEGKTPETTWYIYNAAGNRVRKITERSGYDFSVPSRSKETKYLVLGDIFSRFQGDGTTESLAIATLNVVDATLGRAPMAVIESGSHVTQPLIRYRISEQLELDTEAKLVMYQEFSAFGTKTYQAAKMEAHRAYRFASYRWDSESGLYFCGARYYACWLGRWISVDPLGTVDGFNLYAYVNNDPINFDDPGGTHGGNKNAPSTKAQEEPKTTATQTSQNSTNQTTATQAQTQPNTTQTNSKANQAAPKQATGAPQGQKSNANKVGRLINTSTVDPGYAVLYRSTTVDRAIAFVDQGDVSAVTTRYRGDFNHEPGTASYWSTTEAAARFHGKYSSGDANGEVALIGIQVPISLLRDKNVARYNRDPYADWHWANRVQADRLGWDTKTIQRAIGPISAQNIEEARKYQITIGPESMVKTETYKNLYRNEGKLLENLSPLFLNNQYQAQVAFKGDALKNLNSYRSIYVTFKPG